MHRLVNNVALIPCSCICWAGARAMARTVGASKGSIKRLLLTKATALITGSQRSPASAVMTHRANRPAHPHVAVKRVTSSYLAGTSSSHHIPMTPCPPRCITPTPGSFPCGVLTLSATAQRSLVIHLPGCTF